MGSQRHTPFLYVCGTPKSHNRLQEQGNRPTPALCLLPAMMTPSNQDNKGFRKTIGKAVRGLLGAHRGMKGLRASDSQLPPHPALMGQGGESPMESATSR